MPKVPNAATSCTNCKQPLELDKNGVIPISYGGYELCDDCTEKEEIALEKELAPYYFEGTYKMTQDPTRADFEEWFKTEVRATGRTFEHVFNRNKNGNYSWSDTSDSWIAWQAATKHQSDKCAGLVEIIRVALNWRELSNTPNATLPEAWKLRAEQALKEHRDSVEGG